MQKGDHNNQQQPPRTSEEITETLWCSEALHRSLESSHEVPNYYDVVKVLSEVELPSPSPVLATSCTLTRGDNLIRFHEGQSSGTKRKADDIEGNIEREREREQKSKQHDSQQPGSQSEATEINATEKRRRNLITERIRAIQALVPNCNKRDKASILGDAIEYIKFMQMQVQMMQSMGVGTMPQGLYMSPARQPSLHVPNLAPHFISRPMNGTQYGMPQFGSYFPTDFPIYPPSFPRFPPFVPPMEVGTGSFPWGLPRPLLYPQQIRFPSETSQSVYSTTPSDTIIPTTCPQAGSTVLGQSLYHLPATSQGSHAGVQASLQNILFLGTDQLMAIQ